MRALSDSSSNVFVLIGAAWRRRASAAAMSSVFANAARQLLGFVTGSSGLVQAQAAAPDPPINLTRETASELRKSLPGSVLKLKNGGGFRVVPASRAVEVASDVQTTPKLFVSASGMLEPPAGGRTVQSIDE